MHWLKKSEYFWLLQTSSVQTFKHIFYYWRDNFVYLNQKYSLIYCALSFPLRPYFYYITNHINKNPKPKVSILFLSIYKFLIWRFELFWLLNVGYKTCVSCFNLPGGLNLPTHTQTHTHTKLNIFIFSNNTLLNLYMPLLYLFS